MPEWTTEELEQLTYFLWNEDALGMKLSWKLAEEEFYYGSCIVNT